MDALIIAGISAAAVIGAAIISGVVSARKLNQTVAVHDTKADKNKELLENGQHALSQEHTGLKEQVAQIGNAMKEQIAQVGSAVTFLREEKLKDTARQEALQGKELKVDEIAAILHAVSREVQELRQQVLQLTAERDALRQEVRELALQQEQERHAEDTEEDEWEP